MSFLFMDGDETMEYPDARKKLLAVQTASLTTLYINSNLMFIYLWSTDRNQHRNDKCNRNS